LRKLNRSPDLLSVIIERWEATLKKTNLIRLPDPPIAIVKETSSLYLSAMRHQADIPILAAAILAKPSVILSGNREHFNDAVSQIGLTLYDEWRKDSFILVQSRLVKGGLNEEVFQRNQLDLTATIFPFDWRELEKLNKAKQ